MFSETTTSQLWKTNPPTYSFMSIARHQSFFISGSQTRYYGFSEILPVIMIIDTGNACAEKTTLEARCSIIYKCFVILMLTWTEYDINAPICMLSCIHATGLHFQKSPARGSLRKNSPPRPDPAGNPRGRGTSGIPDIPYEIINSSHRSTSTLGITSLNFCSSVMSCINNG